MKQPLPRNLSYWIGLVLFALVGIGPASGQETDGPSDADRFFPRQGFMLSGYGGAGYNVLLADGETPNNFSTIFAPIMLFQISDRFLFEGEFEFEIEEGVTATDLEYAQIDVSLNDHFTVVAGKFLLPFANFSERFHPTWINRLPSVPAVYGSHGAAAAPSDPMLPILSDIGVQLRGAFDLGNFRTITAEVFVTQGPVVAPDEEEGADGHNDGEPLGAAGKRAAVLGGGGAGGLAFGSNTSDNNDNKMVGGRFGFSLSPYFEANVSGMTAAYDATGDLNFSALALHLEGRHRQFTLHSEFIRTWQDLLEEEDHEGLAAAKGASATGPLNEGGVETLSRTGYWVQMAYRHGPWQPVVRWSQLFDGKAGGETVTDAGRQLAIGLDYWFEPAFVLKLEYLINDEEVDIDNNRLALQLAFGF